MPQEKRIPNYIFRPVSRNWQLDGEYFVRVDMAKLVPGFPFVNGMTYNQCKGNLMSNPLSVLGDDWCLIDLKPESSFEMWAVFGRINIPSRTLAPSVEYITQEEHLWPAVLKGKGMLDIKLDAITDSNLVSVIPNIYLQPETPAMCNVRIRQWYTTAPWTKATMPLPIDVRAAAREVRLGYQGTNRTIKCLHEQVTVPGYAVGGIRSRTYLATAVTTWTSDIKNQQADVGGRYFREERIFDPPFDPLDRGTIPRITSS